MKKRGYTFFKKITIFIVIVIIRITIVMEMEEDKKGIDVYKFLENIRQSIKKILEKSGKRKDKRNYLREFNKARVRRKMMGKFTTFPTFHRKVIIDVKKDAMTGSAEKRDSDKEAEELKKIVTGSTFRKLLEKYPVLNPFLLVLPRDFNKEVKSIGNEGRAEGRAQQEVEIYIREVEKIIEEYFQDVFKKSLLFWEIFEKLFVSDAKRFKYLSFVLCGNGLISEIELQDEGGLSIIGNKEVQYSVFSGDYNIVNERYRFLTSDSYLPLWSRLEKWITARRSIPYIPVFTPLNPFKYHMKSKKYDYVLYPLLEELPEGSLSSGSIKIHAQFRQLLHKKKKSLCYYLTVLAERGKYFAEVFMSEIRMLELYIKNKYTGHPKPLQQIIPRTISFFESYFYGIRYIYTQKILPAVADMCYIKCLCEDIGIRCKLGISGTPEDVATELVILLLYQTGGFKIGIEKFQSYLDTINYLTRLLGEMECLNNIKKDIEKIKEELKRFFNIRVQIGALKEEVEEVLKLVDRENFSQAIQMVYENFRALFIEIFKSGYITNIDTEVRKWDNEIIRGAQQKNICYLDFLYTSVKNIIEKNPHGGNIPFLDFLVAKKIDASVADLRRLTLFDTALFSMNINTVLSYLSILDYKIYAWLSIYKQHKCYFNWTDEQLKDVKTEIEKFECIFNNNDMKVGCYIEKDPIFQNAKAIQQLLEGLLNGLGVNLSNLREKFDGIMLQGVMSYRSSIPQVENFIQLCEKVSGFFNVVAIWERRMFEDKVIMGCYIPDICGNKRCIDLVKEELCSDPIPGCNTITTNQPRVCLTAFNTLFCLNCFISADNKLYEDAYKNTGFSDILKKSPLCGVGVEPERTYNNKACGVAFKLYDDVCKVLEVEKCKGTGVQLRDCVSNNMRSMEPLGKICSSLIYKNSDTFNLFFKNIKEKMGTAHFSLIQQNLTPQKLKDFYSQYKEGTICSQ